MKHILKSMFLLGVLSVSVFAINSNQFINSIECNQTVDKEFFQICYDYDLKAATKQ